MTKLKSHLEERENFTKKVCRIYSTLAFTTPAYTNSIYTFQDPKVINLHILKQISTF